MGAAGVDALDAAGAGAWLDGAGFAGASVWARTGVARQAAAAATSVVNLNRMNETPTAARVSF